MVTVTSITRFMFQLTAARRRLAAESKPLIAGSISFNSQPPGGGWTLNNVSGDITIMFQLTAARRRLEKEKMQKKDNFLVSTHSRPEAAGSPCPYPPAEWIVSTHSRPEAAGLIILLPPNDYQVSTHSRPEAAGCHDAERQSRDSTVSTHSRPEAAGVTYREAAPRYVVSTHSRPEAAGP